MDKTYGISVRSVLEMEVLQGAKLIAGRGGLDRVVTSMNVMEVPDIIDWVSGGELIVTTAYSIKDDVEKARRAGPRPQQSRRRGAGHQAQAVYPRNPAGGHQRRQRAFLPHL